MSPSDFFKTAKSSSVTFNDYLEKITEFYIDSITGKRKTEKIFNFYTVLVDAVRFYLNTSPKFNNASYNKEEVNSNVNYAINYIKNGKYSKFIKEKRII